MNDWQEYKFREIVNFPPSVKLIKGVEYPFIAMEVVNPSNKFVSEEQTKKYTGSNPKFKNGDILFARITPSLDNKKISVTKMKAKEVGFGSTEFFIFRAKPKIADQNFVYYLCKSDLIVQNAINSYVGASGRQRADARFLKNVKIKLPPLPEQEKIADILSAYDDLIENNNRRIAILQEMAEQIYREWFVRMRFPGWQNTEFEKGVPRGWVYDKLGKQISNIKRKPKLKAEEYLLEGKYPIVDQGEGLIAGYTNDKLFVQQTHLPTIVFGDHTRRVKFVDFPFASGADGTQLIYPKNLSLLPNYFYFAIKSIDLSNYAYARHYKFLKCSEILIPESEILRKFHSIISGFFPEVKNLRLKNSNLKKTRDLLLPRLISGRINVNDFKNIKM